jgi:hypothetical protein
MYFNVPLSYFFHIFFPCLLGQAVDLSLNPFNWGVYEYNVVAGLFKLELAIYLHGDLKEKDIVYTELTIKGITIYTWLRGPGRSQFIVSYRSIHV